MVYVLLVISLITAIAITVSVIIINELKLTTGAVDASMAYYAAESGVEQGLFGVRVLRDSNIALADAITRLQVLNSATGISFDNSATYTDAGTSSTSSLIENKEIKMNEYVQADYYDIDNLSGTSDSIMAAMEITNQGDNPNAWAEISWIAWDSSGTLGESTSAKKIIGPTDLHDGMLIHLQSSYTNFTPVGYRVRIKALFGDLSAVSVIPYKNDVTNPQPSDQVDISKLPSQVVIKAVGTKGSYKQALTAMLPWKMPLAGLYDYVLFSEGEINKTSILSKPIFTSGAIQVENNILSGSCATYNACLTLGWQATCAAVNASCNVLSSGGTCASGTASGSSDYWVLPVPSFVPPDNGYYLNFRANYTGAATDYLRIITGDTCFDIPDQGSGWVSCSIPWPDINITSNSKIRFTAKDSSATSFNIDWYQLSTYKLFNDCASVSYCAISQTCPNCECTAGENCPADDSSCENGTPHDAECQDPKCTNGCQAVNRPDTVTSCTGGACCNGTCCATGNQCCPAPKYCFNPASVCSGATCTDDGNLCTQDLCQGSGTCNVACVHPAIVCDNNNDGICPPNNCCPTDPDCATWPTREYLRFIPTDEDGDSLAPLNPTGRSMRINPVWQTLATGTAGTILRDIWAADQLNVWAVGDNGRIYYSRDGGTTWGTQVSNTGNRLDGIWGSGVDDVWIVGFGGVIRHCTSQCNTGGASWNQADVAGFTKNLRDIYGTSATDIWIVSEFAATSSNFLHCDHVTCKLNAKYSGTQNLYGVYAADATRVWGVGAAGTITYSGDGGSSWGPQTWVGRLGTETLNEISGVNNSYIWIAGCHGIGCTTSDIIYYNGATWVALAAPLNTTLYGASAYMESANPRVIITGVSGNGIYCTNAACFAQSVGPTTRSINAVFAKSYNYIWASGLDEARFFGNAPQNTETMNIGFGNDQSWYSAKFTSNQTLKSGNYIMNFWVTAKTGTKTNYTITIGYCNDNAGDNTICNQGLDFTTAGSATFSNENPAVVPGWLLKTVNVPVQKDMACSPSKPCRIWIKISGGASGNNFTVGVGGDVTSSIVNNSWVSFP